MKNSLLFSSATVQSVKIYLPNRDRNSIPVSEEILKPFIDYFKILFCQKFGGCNETPSKSLYLNLNQQIIEENTIILSSFCFYKEFPLGFVSELMDAVISFAETTNQEGVLYEISGVAYLLNIKENVAIAIS